MAAQSRNYREVMVQAQIHPKYHDMLMQKEGTSRQILNFQQFVIDRDEAIKEQRAEMNSILIQVEERLREYVLYKKEHQIEKHPQHDATAAHIASQTLTASKKLKTTEVDIEQLNHKIGALLEKMYVLSVAGVDFNDVMGSARSNLQNNLAKTPPLRVCGKTYSFKSKEDTEKLDAKTKATVNEAMETVIAQSTIAAKATPEKIREMGVRALPVNLLVGIRLVGVARAGMVDENGNTLDGSSQQSIRHATAHVKRHETEIKAKIGEAVKMCLDGESVHEALDEIRDEVEKLAEEKQDLKEQQIAQIKDQLAQLPRVDSLAGIKELFEQAEAEATHNARMGAGAG